MTQTDEEIRRKAVAFMVQLEGQLIQAQHNGQDFMWIACTKTGCILLSQAPTEQHGICRINSEDINKGLTGARWQNIFVSVMNFLRKENKK